MAVTVDVVVVSYNSASTLRSCVEALTTSEDESVTAQVLVVDNASSDGSADSLDGTNARIIRLEDNRGFGYGCNRGWRAGSAPYVLFLNPDARIERSSLALLVRVLQREPGVAIAAPRIVDEGGSLEFSMRRRPRLRSLYSQALFLHRLFPRADWADEVVWSRDAYRRPSSPEWVSGACFLIRRHVLEQIDGFDEDFFMYSEDVDLCQRAVDAGWSIRFVPDALAIHLGGVSAPRSAMIPVLAASRWRYARKTESRVVSTLTRSGLALGALTHALLGRGRANRAGHIRAFVFLIGLHRDTTEAPHQRAASPGRD